MICKVCGEFMEYTDEGEDEDGQLYNLYLCVECGHEEAVPQSDKPHPNRFEWDAPDGSRRY